jgi:hypothetical protein
MYLGHAMSLCKKCTTNPILIIDTWIWTCIMNSLCICYLIILSCYSMFYLFDVYDE